MKTYSDCSFIEISFGWAFFPTIAGRRVNPTKFCSFPESLFGRGKSVRKTGRRELAEGPALPVEDDVGVAAAALDSVSMTISLGGSVWVPLSWSVAFLFLPPPLLFKALELVSRGRLRVDEGSMYGGGGGRRDATPHRGDRVGIVGIGNGRGCVGGCPKRSGTSGGENKVSLGGKIGCCWRCSSCCCCSCSGGAWMPGMGNGEGKGPRGGGGSRGIDGDGIIAWTIGGFGAFAKKNGRGTVATWATGGNMGAAAGEDVGQAIEDGSALLYRLFTASRSCILCCISLCCKLVAASASTLRSTLNVVVPSLGSTSTMLMGTVESPGGSTALPSSSLFLSVFLSLSLCLSFSLLLSFSRFLSLFSSLSLPSFFPLFLLLVHLSLIFSLSSFLSFFLFVSSPLHLFILLFLSTAFGEARLQNWMMIQAQRPPGNARFDSDDTSQFHFPAMHKDEFWWNLWKSKSF